MATEKPTLPAPEEQVSPAAEDAQANPAVTARVPEPEMPAAGPAAEASAAAEEPVAEVADAPAESAVTKTPAAETPAEEAAAERISGEEAAPRAKRARIKPAAGQEVAESEEDASRDVQVDFADEEAALAAQNAGLEIEGATPEEEAAEELAAQKPEEDKFAGKGKEELVALFARMLEEQPVQSIRRDVEALKIAFYRIRRAEVEAADLVILRALRRGHHNGDLAQLRPCLHTAQKLDAVYPREHHVEYNKLGSLLLHGFPELRAVGKSLGLKARGL